MTAKTIRIGCVYRETGSSDIDTLDLKPGVNVVVGLKDTGKTGWLRTISYLLGDKDTPEKGGGGRRREVRHRHPPDERRRRGGHPPAAVERTWGHAQGVRERRGGDERRLLGGVPGEARHPGRPLPQGQPLVRGTWPELSWRELFRHVYLRERFWGDMAEKQYPDTRHACLLQFLGVADKLYPKELEEQIDKRKELPRLQAAKDQFEEVLRQAAKDIIPDQAISNAPTPDSVEQGIARLRDEIESHRSRRETVLTEALRPRPTRRQPIDTELGERRVRLSIRKGEREARGSRRSRGG